MATYALQQPQHLPAIIILLHRVVPGFRMPLYIDCCQMLCARYAFKNVKSAEDRR